MNFISSNMSNMGMRPMHSPREDMDSRISAAAQSGSISSTDQTALESALDNIDSSLASSQSSGSRLEPSEMKNRIDSLIKDQVDNGTLTEEQASTLQSFFAKGPDGKGGSSESGTGSVEGAGGPGGAGGPRGGGGPQGMRGPPPPPPSGDAKGSDSSSSDSNNSSSSTSSSEDVDDKLETLISFLQNLRDNLSSSSNSTYSQSGTSSSKSDTSGLVLDQLA